MNTRRTGLNPRCPVCKVRHSYPLHDEPSSHTTTTPPPPTRERDQARKGIQ